MSVWSRYTTSHSRSRLERDGRYRGPRRSLIVPPGPGIEGPISEHRAAYMKVRKSRAGIIRWVSPATSVLLLASAFVVFRPADSVKADAIQVFASISDGTPETEFVVNDVVYAHVTTLQTGGFACVTSAVPAPLTDPLTIPPKPPVAGTACLS